MTAPAVDLIDPAFLADPYPTYARLRADSPVHPLANGMWLVSRYDDVQRVLRDWETFSSEAGYGNQSPMGGASGLAGPSTGMSALRVVIALDPPDHTRLRRLLSKPFAPRQIQALEPRVREIAGQLIDDLLAASARGEADLHTHLSYPLPVTVTVIAEMLGIPTERKADFKRWSDSVVGGLDPYVDRDWNASFEMVQFFNEVVAQRQTDPGDDLVSILVTQGAEGEDPLTAMEIVVFCILLLIAGNETTTNLLGNLFRALFANPGEMERLRADRALVSSAVEEALRYDSPVQGIWRGTRIDTEVAGVDLPAGTIVMPLFGSANRDNRHYDRPDEFRVDRNPTDHQAFGNGVHLCLGAALARLEARVATDMLLERTSGIEPAGDPTATTNLILRGVVRQPITLIPA